MINRVVLVGRLTRDPELKYTTNNIANTRFTLAVNRQFTNQQGERQADFITCIAWRAQAENMARFLKKGSLVGIEGRIETGSFQGQDGQMRYTTDVIVDSVQFLEPRGTQSENQQNNNGFGNNQSRGFPQQNNFNNQNQNNFSNQNQRNFNQPSNDFSQNKQQSFSQGSMGFGNASNDTPRFDSTIEFDENNLAF